MSQNFCVFEWKSGSNRRRVEVFDRRIIGNNYAHTHTEFLGLVWLVSWLMVLYLEKSEERKVTERGGKDPEDTRQWRT